MNPFIKLSRPLLLDGAMGTMIQRLGLGETDFRGELFSNHTTLLSGNNDVLNLTNPQAIAHLHRQYIEAGADIISTNTFNSNPISQSEYDLATHAGEIARQGAIIARNEADKITDRKILVAGSIGPTNRSASISPDVSDPGARNITFNQLADAYAVQIEALTLGGVDILLFETAFDTLNLKAGLYAARQVAKKTGQPLPIMVSATIADRAGRTLSGQTAEAFAATIEPFENVISLGLNCSFGPEEIGSHLAALKDATTLPLSCHPNAGLPDQLGHYVQTPEKFSKLVADLAKLHKPAVVGGCCGTTPAHIEALCNALDCLDIVPLTQQKKSDTLSLAGMERLNLTPEKGFINIGERCNVAGSRKFLRLINEKKYTEALEIARKQVEGGALILDINMDDALLDSKTEMARFLDLLAAEPEIAKVPVMIDSSKPEVYLEALRHFQGRAIVNSISLKEGEEKFIESARKIHELGAAVVVMAFDEQGQADTFSRKIEISQRAYRLLTETVGFKPCEIIFDVNIMAIATGIEDHNLYARDYIEAAHWIKTNLPGSLTSGGVSNLSFAFRGHNKLREAMHAVFLYHAIKAGLDMAILNPATSVTYSDIDPQLRDLLERVILATDPEAPEELAKYASSYADQKNGAPVSAENDHTEIAPDRKIIEAIVKGHANEIDQSLQELLDSGLKAIDIIQTILMEGMGRVGELFGQGKMFLPQVIKSARTMKTAVEYLQPFMGDDNGTNIHKKGKILFATVKGDVHDIGKNIVGIVLRCNNFEVIDLGVMVTPETIADQIALHNPDIVCLSGLITPSLSEMAKTATVIAQRGYQLPIIVGGATTSELHTALKLAPIYPGPVIHATDASSTPVIAASLLGPEKEQFLSELKLRQMELRDKHLSEQTPLLSLNDAFSKRHPQPLTPASAPKTHEYTDTQIPISAVLPYINTKMLLKAWEIIGKDTQTQADKLLGDADEVLRRLIQSGSTVAATVRIVAASSDGQTIKSGDLTLPMLRQQTPSADGHTYSLADFIAAENDYMGTFAINASQAIETQLKTAEQQNDDYTVLLLRTIADRLAEATSEYLHHLVRTQLWGYDADEKLSPEQCLKTKYKGIRPAVGYPSLPDQSLNHEIATIIHPETIGITLTENGAMNPPASVMGMYFADPASKYFMVGKISDDQLKHYAKLRNTDTENLRDHLGKNI